MNYGLMLAIPALVMFIITPILSPFQPYDTGHFLIPVGSCAIFAAVISVLCAGLLYTKTYTLPERPPRNCFGE